MKSRPYKVSGKLFRYDFDSSTVSCRSRRRPVEKVDRNGNVVAIYASAREAAKKNFISQNSIWARCNGKVNDPFRLDGHDYRYEQRRK